MNAKQLICLLSVTAPVPAAAAPAATLMNNCPATILLLSVLTQAAPYCGSMPIYPAVSEAGFACADRMREATMLALVYQGKLVALGNIADHGKELACDELQLRMWKLEQEIKYPG